MKLDSFATERLAELQRKVNEERAKFNLRPLNKAQVVGELLESAAFQSKMFIGSVFISK